MAKSAAKPKSEYAIQTVTNALRMLEVFHTETEMGVSDLARRLGLHKNNAFRLLATLELAGYIQQTPETELYHLGPRCLELAQAFARSHSLMKQARPILEELARDSGETAHLGVLASGERGDEVVHLDGVLPEALVLSGSRVGERLPAHCTALGKALLSGKLPGRPGAAAATEDAGDSVFLAAPDGVPALGDGQEAGEPALLQQFARWELAGYTDSTVSDAHKLVDELRDVQLRGYATDVGRMRGRDFTAWRRR